MKDKLFGVLQRVGRSFMLPIAILPVAGLLLGIGSSLTNETTLTTYGLMNILGPGTFFHAILQVMSDAGNIVFANLPIIFAIGVAIGMAKREKEVAALSAAIAFFIMHASIGALITINGGAEAMLEGAVTDVCGISSLQMGVFGGIIVGLGVAALHNRYYKIELPQVVSFFGGTRFVPIISALVYTGVGILMFFIWPFIQKGIYSVGNVVLQSGYVGTWVYGFMERLLIPFGLHHVFYLPFWQTAVGGTYEVGGKIIEGAQNIFFAQLADPTVTEFTVSATRFMSGKFPLMIFGLPGAALAMYKTALPKKQKAAGGLLLSAALTSMLTGITEPLEFTFLFVAPLLYGIHCVFAGLAYMLMHVCNVGVGMTFSGGLIDLFLFGILQGNAKTHWYWVVIVGIGYFIVYYILFHLLIVKLNLKTPGRDDNEEVKLYKRSDVDNKKNDNGKDTTSAQIIKGMGGRDNLSDVDCCATRLRCTVKNAALVSEELLKATGASGVIKKGNGIQIIYGPKVSVIKSNLEDYLAMNIEEVEEDAEHPQKQERTANTKKPQKQKAAYDTKTPPKQNTSVDTGKTQPVKPAFEEAITIPSPLTGKVTPLSRVPDEAFANKLMGDGIAILPTEGTLYAPDDGEILFIFDTMHALGFKTKDGVSLMFHVGIDTVKLNGKGFTVLVQNGQKVKKGTALMTIDLDYIKQNAPSIITPILITEGNEGMTIIPCKKGSIKALEPLVKLEPEHN